MRPHLPIVAVVLVTVSLLFSTPSAAAGKPKSLAGRHRPHSILVQKAEPAKNPSPNAAAVFTCETRFFNRSLNPGGGVACYGPGAIRAAYGLTGLISRYTGAGQTIVILDAFGSPTALTDLQAFDSAFGLPNPPSFTVVTMPGTPAFDPTNQDQVGWAEEVSLDVQWSHAMAPGANIVLLAAKSDSDDDLVAGLNYAISNGLGDVVSMSFGESEAFLTDAAGRQSIAKWEKAFKTARDSRITLFVSSGDEGSTNTADNMGDVFPFKNVSYPASSPQVTAVGGTNLFFGIGAIADPNGTYLGEKVWNDESQGIAAAGGGGVSAIFSRPAYQDGLDNPGRASLHKHRGIPDVAYNAGVVGGVVVHLGFHGVPAGFYVFGGTSAGAPQWAGIVADLNQALHRELGFINNRLYRLGGFGVLEREEHERSERHDREGDHDHDRAKLFHDITVGDNSFCGFAAPDGDDVCVPGFRATPGWDLATGWGTPNFGVLMSLFDQWDDDSDEDSVPID
jgi:subtilase family serine protease